MNNVFLNALQMSAQLAVCVVHFISLYHASRSFKFINTSPSQERTFVLKNIKSLKKLSPDSLDVMCKSEINKYIERPKVIHNFNLIEYIADYNSNKRRKISHVVRYVDYSQHREPKNYYREHYYYYKIFFHLLKLKNL